jgi:hypothetical protein
MENLIKEHKLYTKSDRTSCHRWEASQFRLFLHTGACWLLLLLRGAAPKRSRWRGATFESIRRSFLKIAVRVEQMKTRIRLSLPSAWTVSEGSLNVTPISEKTGLARFAMSDRFAALAFDKAIDRATRPHPAPNSKPVQPQMTGLHFAPPPPAIPCRKPARRP